MGNSSLSARYKAEGNQIYLLKSAPCLAASLTVSTGYCSILTIPSPLLNFHACGENHELRQMTAIYEVYSLHALHTHPTHLTKIRSSST